MDIMVNIISNFMIKYHKIKNCFEHFNYSRFILTWDKIYKNSKDILKNKL